MMHTNRSTAPTLPRGLEICEEVVALWSVHSPRLNIGAGDLRIILVISVGIAQPGWARYIDGRKSLEILFRGAACTCCNGRTARGNARDVFSLTCQNESVLVENGMPVTAYSILDYTQPSRQ